MKNLIAAYLLRGPPQTAMMKYIGTRPTSQKIRNWNRSSDRKTPLTVVSMNRIVAKPRTTREIANETPRAARSDRVAYARTAPSDGRNTMRVRIGNSISISHRSEPREGSARVRVDQAQERNREEANDEHEGHEHDVGDALPGQQVVGL